MSITINHIAAYAEPTISHKVIVDDETTILVSARFVVEDLPYSKVRNLDPSSSDPVLASDDVGYFLIEARYIDVPEIGTIAYYEFHVTKDGMTLIDFDGPYRPNSLIISKTLVDIARRLSGRFFPSDPEEWVYHPRPADLIPA